MVESDLCRSVTPTSRCWRPTVRTGDTRAARRSTPTTREPRIPCTGRTGGLFIMAYIENANIQVKVNNKFSRLQGKFYEKLTARKIYINQPDNYFYHGGSKTGEMS